MCSHVCLFRPEKFHVPWFYEKNVSVSLVVFHTYSNASTDPAKLCIHDLLMKSHLHQQTLLQRTLICVLSPSLPKHQALCCKTHLQQGCLKMCPGLIPSNQIEMPLVPGMLVQELHGIAIYHNQDCNRLQVYINLLYRFK